MDGFVGKGGMPKPINGYVGEAPFPNQPIQKGPGNEFPGGVEGQRPSWGLGQSPNLTRSVQMQHGRRVAPLAGLDQAGGGDADLI